MDTRPRPRAIVNGVRRTRTFHYFWCQTCQRAVRIPSSPSPNPNSSFCPFCSHQLRYELDITRPRLLANLPNNLDPSPATQLMNSLALILDPSMRERNTNLDPTTRWVEENDDDGTWIALRFTRPNQRLVNAGGHDANANATVPNNRRPGPPPAADSAIERLPTVKPTEIQLASDPNCAICKDEFRVEMEVKELPCKHFYHSDCIVPWLRIHNTCPICRHEIEVGGGGGGRDSSLNSHMQDELNFEHLNGLGLGLEEAGYTLNSVWSQIASFRPFRAFWDWTQRYYFDFQENHGGAVISQEKPKSK
ncbi:putative E3 ubiquitin-protein ligase RHC1A [Senna tora]|uniref:RING-type E3 ubiquitin transferase n=1 Tax=Senna tora TaxID=362788 RepID=A0A834XCQ5_9FABA|nr:putative E3 ubiquitin-protein ligase RHC1A [Senna tora]